MYVRTTCALRVVRSSLLGAAGVLIGSCVAPAGVSLSTTTRKEGDGESFGHGEGRVWRCSCCFKHPFPVYSEERRLAPFAPL